MRQRITRLLAMASIMALLGSVISPGTARAEEMRDSDESLATEVVQETEDKNETVIEDGEEESEIQNSENPPASQNPEESNNEESVGQESGQESEQTEEEKSDAYYTEQNDLANSWRFADGEPIQSKARAAVQFSTWPKVDEAVAYGIDVSHHNGTINWSKAKAAGVDYAIIRCGYGMDQKDQDDSQWEANADACEKYGIPYGTYIYSYATTTARARSEADHVLRLIKGRDMDYPIYFDMEDVTLEKLSAKTKGDIAEAFCDRIEAAGYEAAIYANTNWFTNYLTDSRFDQWDKWVAQYNTACTYKGTYSMWQCSSKGRVNGISGNVDLNIDYGAALDSDSGPYLRKEDGETYCYLDGQKVFGEQRVDGYWYYFDEAKNGVMVTGLYDVPVDEKTTKRVFYSMEGRMQYGEQRINGYWYYFDTRTGEMQTGFVDLPEKTVYYSEKGQMQYGEQKIGDEFYYFETRTGERAEESWRDTTDQSGRKIRVYYDEEGCRVSGEQRINGYWYYFDGSRDGTMVTGWYDVPVDEKTTKQVYYNAKGRMQYGEQRINGYWYYFNTRTGEMQTGFVMLPGKRVYYSERGQMQYGEQIIGGFPYYFDTRTGAMRTGWYTKGENKYYYAPAGIVFGELKINGHWYYFDEMTAVMRTGLVQHHGHTYYYNSKGQMHYGEKQLDGKWYYFYPRTGVMAEGWIEHSGNTYYYQNGIRCLGWNDIEGTTYLFDPLTGVLKPGWSKENGAIYYYIKDEKQLGALEIEGEHFYFDPELDGEMITGWKTYDGNTYYFDEEGKRVSGWYKIGDTEYYFGQTTGICEEGFERKNKVAYFYLESGKKYLGEKRIDGKWYYFDPAKDGQMATGWREIPESSGTKKKVYYNTDGTMCYGEKRINEKWYCFDGRTGKMITGWHDLPEKRVYYGSDGVMRYGWQTIGGIKYYFNTRTGALEQTSVMEQKAQSYSSSTKWLVLVDTKSNHVGIYSGKKNNWDEKKYWSCTSGAKATPTPKGSYTVKAKGKSFGSGYTCWYYTQFYGNYLFHSVLYQPGSMSRIKDGRLGINASHGCVRLALSNAKWIYDNIPRGTKVVIY